MHEEQRESRNTGNLSPRQPDTVRGSTTEILSFYGEHRMCCIFDSSVSKTLLCLKARAPYAKVASSLSPLFQKVWKALKVLFFLKPSLLAGLDQFIKKSQV